MMNSHKIRVHEFWNERASYGQNAGSNDFLLKELEERALCQHIPPRTHVLDIGCGNGATLLRLARENQCTGLGVDYAEKLLELAQQACREQHLANSLQFARGNVLELDAIPGVHNHIFTQRCLINLETKEEQKSAFGSIIKQLQPGGFYYMIEAFNEGNRALNVLRNNFGLEPMTSPWHNLFFEMEEVLNWQHSFPAKPVLVSHFASTYYFLSRVVYAKLAADRGEELRYDSDINKLSLELPPLGEFGATKLIIWKRESE